MKKNRTAEVVAADWFEAKAQEKRWNEIRCQHEAELAALLAFDKPEGSKTFNEGPYKITLTAKMTYTPDWAEFDAVKAGIPAEMIPEKDPKRVLDETGVKYLRDNFPAIYATIAKAITVKPAKTACVIVKTED